MYEKFCDCLYVVAENSSKFNFKGSVLSNAVRFVILIIGHNCAVFHCLQTFFSNSICCVLSGEITNYTENVLNSLVNSCEMTFKLGYEQAMNITYPYINQFLRLFIEYIINNTYKVNWKKNITDTLQEIVLKIILYLMDILKKTKQMLKCDGCSVRTGQHDALRLSFLSKSFISVSLNLEVDVTKVLPTYNLVIEKQHKILDELRVLQCVNVEKCFRKLQTDIHNTAIALNKSKYYSFSLKLFDIYLTKEIKHFKTDNELRNISRALYNKSICELDFEMHENALKTAYLSLIFALPDGLQSEKYMSLVMDIKAKMLKKNADESVTMNEDLQLVTVLEACKMSVDNNPYGNLKPFIRHLNFSELLKHEYTMYAKLWPSVLPIAGVWESLYRLKIGEHNNWLTGQNKAATMCLYETILLTTKAVRTLTSDHFCKIITRLLEDFQVNSPTTEIDKLVYASLLFLKAEYNLNEASVEYGWKDIDVNSDSEAIQANRTLEQEHKAVLGAVKAVDIWTDVAKNTKLIAGTQIVSSALSIAILYIETFLHLSRLEIGLQLAKNCCEVALHVVDKKSFLRAFSSLISYADTKIVYIDKNITTATEWGVQLQEEKEIELYLLYLCNLAMYKSRCGENGLAARLVQYVQAQVVNNMDKHTGINLDLAIGLLLEAQSTLCKNNNCGLSMVNSIQRHYIAVTNNETNWIHRKLRAVSIKRCVSRSATVCVRLCSSLRAYRRGAAVLQCAAPAAAAIGVADMIQAAVNVHSGDEAQTFIDNRLKYILGIIQTTEIQPQRKGTESKIEQQLFTPKQDIETMRENLVFKKCQTSPSVPCISIPGFKLPDFMTHENCNCYSCNIPFILILTCSTFGLEASTYFRAKEYDIAKNYFQGTLNMFETAERRIKEIKNNNYDDFILDIVLRFYLRELKRSEVRTLIEAAYFELSQSFYKKTDEIVIKIHEIVQENEADVYIQNEILNLMIASTKLREIVKIENITDLEIDMDSLKLTPSKEPPRTPVSKTEKPKIITPKIVSDEEVPKLKRKVIKLNLDEENETPVQTRSKCPVFKVPILAAKPIPELITPKTRGKPNIVLTQASQEVNENIEFFTPKENSADQFFTPMTSVRTYSKKEKNNIIKNLEMEFSTPLTERISDDAKVDTERKKNEADKRKLKRATSPGKLSKEVKKIPVRTRRLKNFSVAED